MSEIKTESYVMNKEQSRPSPSEKFDQYYYGHGKLLLTGEYFVLDGATGLALPTTVGQSMGVRYSQSFNPKLTWKSFDVKGNLWLEATFEFWHFNILDENPTDEVVFLQKVLREARAQNKHFLREGQDVYVETRLGFPLSWGLGSSSTLIYNIAQWAYISPFELLFKTHGGSGYDIACAGSDGPIVYELEKAGPKYGPVTFYPEFHEDLYFVYLGKKKDSREAIEYFKSKQPFPRDVVREVSALSREMLEAKSLDEFEHLLRSHEQLLSSQLGLPSVKEERFSDFDGEVKSLGAWGGDFVIVTCRHEEERLKAYFEGKGLDVVIPFSELILRTPSHLPNQKQSELVH
ncbi:MAG: GYDIA family GHMP kinase [Bdellovibrionota bacterium]|nr:GYDIA family GHMP kinase [Bdellovibrionota bacterium]